MSLKFVSCDPIYKNRASTGSDTCTAPNKRQFIIWISKDIQRIPLFHDLTLMMTSFYSSINTSLGCVNYKKLAVSTYEF